MTNQATDSPSSYTSTPSGPLAIDKIKIHKINFDEQVKMLDLIQKDEFLDAKTLKEQVWLTMKHFDEHPAKFTIAGKLFGLHPSNAR